MDEVLIWYEHEVETLRSRVKQQNVDILSLTQQIQTRYKMYSELEADFIALKTEYEKFKIECILYHRKDAESSSPPPLELWKSLSFSRVMRGESYSRARVSPRIQDVDETW
jgi:hypothetical protein